MVQSLDQIYDRLFNGIADFWVFVIKRSKNLYRSNDLNLVNEIQIKAFRDAMIKYLRELPKDQARSIHIGMDYEPDRHLQAVLLASKMDISPEALFPIKTACAITTKAPVLRGISYYQEYFVYGEIDRYSMKRGIQAWKKLLSFEVCFYLGGRIEILNETDDLSKEEDLFSCIHCQGCSHWKEYSCQNPNGCCPYDPQVVDGDF
jgi:hypothetical protein